MTRMRKVFDVVGFLAFMVSFLEVVTWSVVFPVRMTASILTVIFGFFVIFGKFLQNKGGVSL